MQASQGAIQGFFEFLSGAADRLPVRWSISTHCDRLEASQSRLHDTAFVVTIGFLAAALVGEMHFHPRDSFTKPPQRVLDNAFDVACEVSTPCRVIVCINLDLHR